MYVGKLSSITKDSRRYTENAGTINQQKIIKSNFVTIKKSTLLYEAVKNNNLAKVQELVKKGAFLDQPCYGLTPLQFTILANGLEEIITFLLDAGADLNFHDETSTSYNNVDFLNIAKKHDTYSDNLINRLEKLQKTGIESKYFCVIL